MKRMAATLMVGGIVLMSGAGTASAQDADYPPNTDPAKIDVAAFGPVCQQDIPYISYNIEVSGTDATTASLTFFDKNGNQVASYSGMPFSGSVIYPGASQAPDWPGWKYEGGSWVEDPSDAHLREGLTVRVEVNPTATSKVSYPPATAACNGPEVSPNPPTPESESSGALPPTGSNGTLPMVLIAGGLVGAGALLFGSARRRKTAA
jgi:hypothetical protein